MQRLKASEIPGCRNEFLAKQDGRCGLCGERFVPGEVVVLDHDHKTGYVRGALHRGCNAALGHIENNRARNGLLGGRLGRMLGGVMAYLHQDHSVNPLHPTHKTPEEKRVRINKRAALARAKKKASL